MLKRVCPLLAAVLLPFWIMALWHMVATKPLRPPSAGYSLAFCPTPLATPMEAGRPVAAFGLCRDVEEGRQWAI